MPQFSKKRGRGSPPKILQHASGQACVVLDGKTIYLGKFDTPDAHRNYAAAIEAWQADNAPGCVRTRRSGDPSKSVADVVLLFDQWIDQRAST